MASSSKRAEWRTTNTKIVTDWAKHNKFTIQHLNNGYQIRIHDILDVYVVNRRWHILENGKRGDWKTAGDLNAAFYKADEATPIKGKDDPRFMPPRGIPLVRRIEEHSGDIAIGGDTMDIDEFNRRNNTHITGVNKVTVHNVDVEPHEPYSNVNETVQSIIARAKKQRGHKWWQFWKRWT